MEKVQIKHVDAKGFEDLCVQLKEKLLEHVRDSIDIGKKCVFDKCMFRNIVSFLFKYSVKSVYCTCYFMYER